MGVDWGAMYRERQWALLVNRDAKGQEQEYGVYGPLMVLFPPNPTVFFLVWISFFYHRAASLPQEAAEE